MGGEGVAMLWANGSYYRSYSNLGQKWLDKNEHISSMFVSHMLSGKSTIEFHISYYSMYSAKNQPTEELTITKDQLIERVRSIFLTKYSKYSTDVII